MIKKLFVGGCLALSLAACATNPAATQATPATLAANSQAPVGCVNGTGTRLPVKPTDCVGFGSVYGKTQIDETGRPYLQDSLNMINTTMTVTGSVQQGSGGLK